MPKTAVYNSSRTLQTRDFGLRPRRDKKYIYTRKNYIYTKKNYNYTKKRQSSLFTNIMRYSNIKTTATDECMEFDDIIDILAHGLYELDDVDENLQSSFDRQDNITAIIINDRAIFDDIIDILAHGLFKLDDVDENLQSSFDRQDNITAVIDNDRASFDKFIMLSNKFVENDYSHISGCNIFTDKCDYLDYIDNKHDNCYLDNDIIMLFDDI